MLARGSEKVARCRPKEAKERNFDFEKARECVFGFDRWLGDGAPGRHEAFRVPSAAGSSGFGAFLLGFGRPRLGREGQQGVRTEDEWQNRRSTLPSTPMRLALLFKAILGDRRRAKTCQDVS